MGVEISDIYIMLHPVESDPQVDTVMRDWWSDTGDQLPGMLWRGECADTLGECTPPAACTDDYPPRYADSSNGGNGTNWTSTHICLLDGVKKAFDKLMAAEPRDSGRPARGRPRDSKPTCHAVPT